MQKALRFGEKVCVISKEPPFYGAESIWNSSGFVELWNRPIEHNKRLSLEDAYSSGTCDQERHKKGLSFPQTARSWLQIQDSTQSDQVQPRP